MLTSLKSVVKRLPPFRGLIRERDKLAGEVVRLHTELAQHTNWGTPSYNGDGLRTYAKNLSFLTDESFQKAYRAGTAAGLMRWAPEEIHIEYRAHVICWAGQHAKKLPGDFVECGVNRGCLSVTLCNYIDFNATGKSFYLFDTFNCIPDQQMSSAERGSVIGKINRFFVLLCG